MNAKQAALDILRGAKDDAALIDAIHYANRLFYLSAEGSRTEGFFASLAEELGAEFDRRQKEASK